LETAAAHIWVSPPTRGVPALAAKIGPRSVISSSARRDIPSAGHGTPDRAAPAPDAPACKEYERHDRPPPAAVGLLPAVRAGRVRGRPAPPPRAPPPGAPRLQGVRAP